MDSGSSIDGGREADKPTAQVFSEVAEQTRLADGSGTRSPGSPSTISRITACVRRHDEWWRMRLDHQKGSGSAPRWWCCLVQPGSARRRNRQRPTPCRMADWCSHRRRYQALHSRGSASHSPELEMTDEFCDIPRPGLQPRISSANNGKHYQMPDTHIPARPVQNPLPIYVAAIPRGCSAPPRAMAIGC